jgi:hypothetical protein
MAINLDNDAQILETIRRAADGDELSAWFLIHQIETALLARRVSGPLFDYAATFFSELLNLHDLDKDRPGDLRSALRKLYIVRSPGNPKTDDQEIKCLAARVVLLSQAGYSVDVALIALGSTKLPDEMTRTSGAYKSAYYQTVEGEALGKFMDQIMLRTELEILAGFTSAELLMALNTEGALPL